MEQVHGDGLSRIRYLLLPSDILTLAAGLCVYAFFKFVIEPKWIGFLLTAGLVSGFWIALKHLPYRCAARLVVSAALIAPLVGFYAWLQHSIDPDWVAFVLAPIAVVVFWVLYLWAVELASGPDTTEAR
jgi:hypothetical protein